MVAVGTWIWLASDLMFFAALFAAYFNLRGITNAQAAAAGTQSMWEWGAAHFNMPFAATNTLILILSSVTCQMGVCAAERGDVHKLRMWFIITFVMGAVFIGGQLFEYSNLVAEGFTLQTNAYTSAFFLATGFHGLHVTGGLIAFLLMLGRTYMARKFTHEQAVHAIVTSYYWHFVDAIWIILFFALYILR